MKTYELPEEPDVNILYSSNGIKFTKHCDVWRMEGSGNAYSWADILEVGEPLIEFPPYNVGENISSNEVWNLSSGSMKTRLRLIADHMSAVAICDGIKYTDDGMVQLKSDKIADYLLEQGWRPPMQKISTIEELESLPVWTELLDADYGLIQKVDSPYGTFIRPGSMAYWSAHDIVNCGPFLVQWEPECES